MKTYYITVTETLQRTFRVVAEDYDEAEEKLTDVFNSDEIELDASDFTDRAFENTTESVLLLVNEGFLKENEFEEVK